MVTERSVLCGDVSYGGLPFGGDSPLSLHLQGARGNISCKINNIPSHVLRDIPSRFHDLIEIAAYVYCGDQAISRGGQGAQNVGASWRRRLFFRIPVRDPDLWNDSPQKDQLIETLSFLTEDEYHFDFEKLKEPPPTQQSMDLDLPSPEEVLLFSGGLDSLGGAVLESVVNKRRVALVMHKATEKLNRRHEKLINLLKNHCTSSLQYIPVSINKNKSLSRDFSQRSRSFLYFALASTVSHMLGLNRIRMYENGIVSLNLPPSPQVVGARATRTTHPQVINGFGRIASTLAERPFVVENPFLWKTKAEILRGIVDAGCAEMIKYATSCTHTMKMTKLKTHCGACSQCIDRRFAVLAANVEDHDPEEAYGVDLIKGERPGESFSDGKRDRDDSRTMIAAYVETASDICRMSALEFFGRYGEVSRVLKHLDGSADATALKVFELYRRHAKAVSEVIDQSIVTYAGAIRERRLPDSCLLRLVCDSSLPSYGCSDASASRYETHEVLKDCVFRKKGQAWIVRYAGGADFILLPSQGAAYLHILLSNPQREFSVADLVLRVAGAPHEYQLGSAGDALDQKALTAYHLRYKELQQELDEAHNCKEQGMDYPVSESAIREEMALLLEEVRKNTGLGMRSRRVSADRDRLRKAFLANIRRVRKEIARYDARFAEHLKSPRLRCGWSPRYDPHEDITWDV